MHTGAGTGSRRSRRSLYALAVAAAVTVGLVSVVPRSSSAVIVTPGEPTAVAATAGPAPGAVRISWQAPTWHGTSAITTYMYSVSVDGGTTWSPPATLNRTIHLVDSSEFPAIACHNTAIGSKGC